MQPFAGLPDRSLPLAGARILYARSAFWDTTFGPCVELADGLPVAVFHRDEAELAGLDAEPGQKGGKCRANRPKRPVLDLQREPETVGRAGAEQALRATLGRPSRRAPERASRRPRPARAASPGARCIAATTRGPPSSSRQAPERVRAAVERERERRHAAAVDRDRDRGGVDLGRGGDLGEHLLLQRMRREPVARRLEPARPADGEEAGVLARAVVLDRRRLRRRSRARPRPPAPRRAARGRPRAARAAARCDAQAIASSRSPRSGRARTSGSAWSGFADERRNVRSRGSPASATILPVAHRDARGPCAPPRRRRRASLRPGSGRPLREDYA